MAEQMRATGEEEENTPPPSSVDLARAVVDLAAGHPNQKHRRKALVYLATIALGPIGAHWILNLQAKANEPDPAAIAAKLEAHDQQLKAISNDVKTMAGNVDTLTRFVIGDRAQIAKAAPAVSAPMTPADGPAMSANAKQ